MVAQTIGDLKKEGFSDEQITNEAVIALQEELGEAATTAVLVEYLVKHHKPSEQFKDRFIHMWPDYDPEEDEEEDFDCDLEDVDEAEASLRAAGYSNISQALVNFGISMPSGALLREEIEAAFASGYTLLDIEEEL